MRDVKHTMNVVGHHLFLGVVRVVPVGCANRRLASLRQGRTPYGAA